MPEKLIEAIHNGKLFQYKLDDGGSGIVIAETMEDAEKKVIEAYKKHGGEDDYTPTVYLWEFMDGHYFEDCPDVLELPEE